MIGRLEILRGMINLMNAQIIGIPGTKRQHYLPKFFLKRFTDKEGRLSCLQRGQDGSRKLLTRQSIENVGVKKFLYEVPVPAEEGKSQYIFPNNIENIFSQIESNMKDKLEVISETLAVMGCGSSISDNELDELLSHLSLYLAWFVLRHPKSICRIRSERSAIDILREKHLTTSTSLKEAFVKVTSIGQEIPETCFMLESMAEILSIYINLITPFDSNVESGVREGLPLYGLCFYLRKCSVIVFVLSDTTVPLIGVDFPVTVDIVPGVVGHYWPISSEISLLFVDDNRSIFGKHSVAAEEANELNLVALDSCDWSLAFCRDPKNFE